MAGPAVRLTSARATFLLPRKEAQKIKHSKKVLGSGGFFVTDLAEDPHRVISDARLIQRAIANRWPVSETGVVIVGRPVRPIAAAANWQTQRHLWADLVRRSRITLAPNI